MYYLNNSKYAINISILLQQGNTLWYSTMYLLSVQSYFHNKY